MVRLYHAIFSAYGFWLPNDPRGSWSEFVHSWELFRAGGIAKAVTGQRSYALETHDADRRRSAKQSLLFPPARFDEPTRKAIAAGFADACGTFDIPLHACAI